MHRSRKRMWAEAKDLPRSHQDALGSVVWAQMRKALDDKAETGGPRLDCR